ncbi:hypothetical protein [Nocardia sp. NPDC047038]|uniref:hypothetical protein n=1 Tax=Nocardia sp. NPDC047038 TaxID=3154338 RepID=UPI0033EEF508
MAASDPAIYQGTYSTCVFNADKALCTRTSTLQGTPQPALVDCKPLDCRNVALTAANHAALGEELQRLRHELDTRPGLPPLLLARLTHRAGTVAAFLDRHTPRSPR